MEKGCGQMDINSPILPKFSVLHKGGTASAAPCRVFLAIASLFRVGGYLQGEPGIYSGSRIFTGEVRITRLQDNLNSHYKLGQSRIIVESAHTYM